jgi:molybdopterin-biosynthesis enzyme MoeA-like protein
VAAAGVDRVTTNRGPRPLRTAEVLAIGSELLGSTRLDTNSLFIADQLSSIGIELRAKAVVGDNRREVSELLRGGSASSVAASACQR